MKDELIIRNLTYLQRTYAGLTRLIASTRNRIQATNPDANVDTMEEIQTMESLKGKIARRMEKALQLYEIWNAWLQQVRGIGPAIAAELVIFYYYRFQFVCGKCGGDLEKVDKTFKCSKCGKQHKGEGIPPTRIDERDFPTISKWWKYMGMHIEDGHKPKRKSGQLANWSTKGRTLCWHIAGHLIMSGDPFYRSFYDARKAKREGSGKTKRHIDNMAKNETAKLFLAHFWQVARELEGKETSKPYACTIMGHTNFIDPPHWKGMLHLDLHIVMPDEPTEAFNPLGTCEGCETRPEA